jgi:hypothetical protein
LFTGFTAILGKQPMIFGDEPHPDKVPDDTLNGDVDIYLEDIATEYKVSYAVPVVLFSSTHDCLIFALAFQAL